MKEIFEYNLDKFFEYCYAVAVAVLGGLIRLITDSEKHTFRDFLAEGTIAAFSGIIMYHFVSEFKFSGQMISALCGIAGFSGREFLHIVKSKIIKKIRKKNLP